MTALRTNVRDPPMPSHMSGLPTFTRSFTEVFDYLRYSSTITVDLVSATNNQTVVSVAYPRYKRAERYPRNSAPRLLLIKSDSSPSRIGFQRPALQAIAQPAAPAAHMAKTLRAFRTEAGTFPPSSEIVGSVSGVRLELRRFWETEDRRLEPGSPMSLGLRPSNG